MLFELNFPGKEILQELLNWLNWLQMLSLVSLSNERIYMYFVFLRRIIERVIWLFTLDLLVHSKGYAVRWIFKIYIIFFQINGGNIEIHTVQSKSNINNLIFILFLKVMQKCRNIELSNYRAVELSSCRTIELPIPMTPFSPSCGRTYTINCDPEDQ